MKYKEFPQVKTISLSDLFKCNLNAKVALDILYTYTLKSTIFEQLSLAQKHQAV